MVQMAREGFQKAGYEGAMWSRKDKDGDTILVATHVDDSIVTGSNDDKSDTFMRDMLERFDGTCERNLTKILVPGFWQYSKPTKTPQAPDTRLSAADKPATPDSVMHRRYRAIVGALGWPQPVHHRPGVCPGCGVAWRPHYGSSPRLRPSPPAAPTPRRR